MPTTMPTKTDYRLISADSHVLEPADLWTSRVASKYVDRVPRVEWLPQGGAWVIEGAAEPIAFGFTMSAGRKAEDLLDWLSKEEMRPEIWGDPVARIAIQDADDIDAELLFPNRPFQGVIANRDPEFHLAMVQAYNDWLSEFCSHAPHRFGGMAAIPNRGVADAVAEVERTASMPGVVGFLLSCYPHGTTTIDPADDPVWEAIQATGKPLAIHIMLNDDPPFQLAANTLPGTGHFYDAPGRMLEIIFSGILDRFPDLEIVFHETDCGWVPYFVGQADDNYLRHSKASLKDERLARLPSEYVRERFSFSFIHDTLAMENRHRIGVDRILWSNDYPHIASDWPNSWKTVNAQLSELPADERHAICAGNVQRLYGIGQEPAA